ncbi:MAG: hypothetical protein JW814_09750 [Candidatus Krumholzibacteriota bacterium]|nr:hypothetical protein [Candidatus Krumholzibacteriota bacterium]
MSDSKNDDSENKEPRERLESDPPEASAGWGWRYHHLGVPVKEKRTGERYLADFRMYVSGFGHNPFGIETMRFEPDSPVSEIIQRLPHLAFEVDDLDKAIEGYEIIGEIGSPMKGIRVAMIISDGFPVELIEFERCWQDTDDSQ